MDVRLDGRTALITGGSLGLGRAMAQRFAEAGAQVAIVARRPEVLDEAAQAIHAGLGTGSGGVRGYPCDVRDAGQLNAMFKRVVEDLGRVDILVNNAGTSRTGKFEDITDEVWQEDLDLKLFSAVRLSRLALPGMKARRWGRILNVLNTGAKAPAAGGAPTAVTRAAGMALTKVLAGEGAPHNVLVNAMLVGLIVSDQWRQRHAREQRHPSFEDYARELGKAVPIGRMGQPEEFADLACFLASDRGSYITGTAINVDGGRSPVV
jgi:NAD(P)-dependent dehydrogenase (short-subunit alcohol dehydrogenase family)